MCLVQQETLSLKQNEVVKSQNFARIVILLLLICEKDLLTFSLQVRKIISPVPISSRGKYSAVTAEMQCSLYQRCKTLSYYFLQFSWQILFSSHKYFLNFPYSMSWIQPKHLKLNLQAKFLILVAVFQWSLTLAEFTYNQFCKMQRKLTCTWRRQLHWKRFL